MAIVGEEITCLVDLEVKLLQKIICTHEKFKVESDKLVIPCNGLEDFKGKDDLVISAKFYDLEGNFIEENLQQSETFW